MRSVAGLVCGLAAAAWPAMGLAQRLDFNSGVRVSAVASTNPDLAPRGQEQGDVWLVLSPFFSVTGSLGERFTLAGSFGLGASLRLSAREGATASSSLRPSGSLAGTLEVIDNFFFVDLRAGVQSSINDPFLATTDPFSPVNTSTRYQLGIAPYIRGTAFGDVQYEVRSDNAWTDDAWGSGERDFKGQYSATNTIRFDRPPRPLGWAFSFQQRLLSSSVEDQGLLKTETARFSLRYALTSNLAVGARLGAERYNFTLAATDWRRYYGAEASWRPNERTSLEGYWEDRVFGNSWQVAFGYRRPLFAINATSSRLISNTPQQFLTFPGLASLFSLLDSAFATRITDPLERRRAVIDFLSRTQLPAELLAPSIIYTQNFTIRELNNVRLVSFGRLHSIALTVYQNVTQYSAGIATELPLANKTKENGVELAFNRRLAQGASATATASWRETQNALNTAQRTAQTQLRLEASKNLSRRTDATLGARYQWISSTVTNDATEAAIFATLSYQLD
jgi:uncharacterized protein (PEP-CTERM system associated)